MKASEVAAIHLGANKTRKLVLDIGGSLETYNRQHPKARLIQDALLYTVADMIIWRGDVDLVRDANTLMLIAEQTGKVIYIFSKEGLADYLAGVPEGAIEEADMLSYAEGKVCVQQKLFGDE